MKPVARTMTGWIAGAALLGLIGWGVYELLLR